MHVFTNVQLKFFLVAFSILFAFGNYAQAMEAAAARPEPTHVALFFFTNSATAMEAAAVRPDEPTDAEILEAAQKVLDSGNCWGFSEVISRKKTVLSRQIQRQIMGFKFADGRSLVDVLCAFYDTSVVRRLFDLVDTPHLTNYLITASLKNGLLLTSKLKVPGDTSEVAEICGTYFDVNIRQAFQGVLSKKELTYDDIDFVKFLISQPLSHEQKVAIKGILESWRGQREGSVTTGTIVHLLSNAPYCLHALFNITGLGLFQEVDADGKTPFTKNLVEALDAALRIQVQGTDYYNFVIEQIRPYMVAAVQDRLATANLREIAFLLKFPFDDSQKSVLQAQLMDFRFDRGGKTLAHGFVDGHMHASLCDLVKIVGPGILEVPNTDGALPLTQENFPAFFQRIDMDECDKDALMLMVPFIHGHFSDFLGDIFQKTLGTIRAEKYVNYHVKPDFLKLFHMCPDLFEGLGLEDVTYMIPTLSEGPRGREFLRGYEVDGVSLLRRYAQICDDATRACADGVRSTRDYQAEESLAGMILGYLSDGIPLPEGDLRLEHISLLTGKLSGIPEGREFLRRYEFGGISLLKHYAQMYDDRRRDDSDDLGVLWRRSCQVEEDLVTMVQVYLSDGIPLPEGDLGLEHMGFLIHRFSRAPESHEYLRKFKVGSVSLLKHYAQMYDDAIKSDADDDRGMKAHQAQAGLESLVRVYFEDGIDFPRQDLNITQQNAFVLSGVGFDTLLPFIQHYRNSRGENWAHWVCAGAINLSDDVDSTSVFALFNQADHEGNTPIQVLANQGIRTPYHLSSILRAIPELAGIPLQGQTTFLMLLAVNDISAYNRLMQEPADIAWMQQHNPGRYANYLRRKELLNAACDLVDDYGHSARSIAAMHEAEDGVDDYSGGRYRRYSVSDVLFRNACEKMPFDTDIWQKMGAFPYVKTNSHQWLNAVFERKPTDDTMAFFHQSVDVKRRENVNRLWQAYFEAHDSEQQARLQAEELRQRLAGHGDLRWIESEKQAVEANNRMYIVIRCLEALRNIVPPSEEDDAAPTYSMKTATINLLTGRSSFGFNLHLQLTDKEAFIMLESIGDLTQGVTDITALAQSFNQEPVDSLTREGLRALKIHQRMCAEVAVFLCQNPHGLLRANSTTYKAVDEIVTPVFGEASSAATLKKRSEGGVIPDFIFDGGV